MTTYWFTKPKKIFSKEVDEMIDEENNFESSLEEQEELDKDLEHQKEFQELQNLAMLDIEKKLSHLRSLQAFKDGSYKEAILMKNSLSSLWLSQRWTEGNFSLPIV